MGRPITCPDEGHKWHREQVARSRLKYKDTFKPIDKPTATVKPIDNPKIRQEINESPTLNKRMEQIKKEIIVEPGRIAQMVYARKCTNCASKECNGIDPCEEYKRLYEYERIASTRPKSFGI